MKMKQLCCKRTRGFSRADLLTLLFLAVFAALLPMQLSNFGSNQGRSSRTAACMANQQRLALAWNLYSADNLGRLPANYSASSPNATLWVNGNLDFGSSSPDNTNVSSITRGLLFPYVQNLSCYVCPADPVRVRGRSTTNLTPMVRSYSMNAYMNGSAWTAGFHLFLNRNQIRKPQETFVFIDERYDSINDSMFYVDMNGYPANASATAIVDYPGFYHDNGAVLAFADEHVEHWIWSDPRTTPPPAATDLRLNVPSPNNRDMARLQAVTTYKD
jgi:hypothetical protein